YAAFMDEAGIDARGLAPVQAELAAINGLADKAALSQHLGGTVRADVDLLNATDMTTDRILGLWVTQDFDEPTKVSPYLVQGGLGMPDRAYYLDDAPRMVEARGKYRAHIARVLQLAGDAQAEAKAARVLALETAIARSHATAEDSADVRKGNNHWAKGDFAGRAPGMDWTRFFAGAGLAEQATFVVWQPSAVTGLASQVGSASLDDWKAYLAFHALDRASPMLPKAFADENFAFHGTALSGTPQQADRWKRGVNQANAYVGHAVGKLYVERHFTPEAKARAEEMVRNLLTAFARRIDNLEWMTPQTRARAHRKLAALTVSIGYPEHWTTYDGLEIRRDDPVGNAERAQRQHYQRQLAKLGRPVSHDEWYMLPQAVNALNVPLENRLIFPAAILGAPFFDPNADAAVNYGAIGGVIGHEITHSFDSTGALFDETGKLNNWWTPEDFAHFEASTAALAAQYDQYKPFPDLSMNGRLTLAENVADVAGLATAYDAYRLSLNGREAPVIGGFTGDQRLFMGWAQIYRAKFREPAMRQTVLTNAHSPGEYRASTVRNIDAWYTAFNVQPGERLALPANRRVKVW
ncbi:MAG TPA: M13 family metallopeptidase, partial [Caulobacteraceae bacterium]